jgi:hypothetical protein
MCEGARACVMELQQCSAFASLRVTADGMM